MFTQKPFIGFFSFLNIARETWIAHGCPPKPVAKLTKVTPAALYKEEVAVLFQDAQTAANFRANKYAAANLVYLRDPDWDKLQLLLKACTYPSEVVLPGFLPITKPEYAEFIGIKRGTTVGYFDSSVSVLRDWPGLDSLMRSEMLTHLTDGTIARVLRTDKIRQKEAKKAAPPAAAAAGPSTAAGTSAAAAAGSSAAAGTSAAAAAAGTSAAAAAAGTSAAAAAGPSEVEVQEEEEEAEPVSSNGGSDA